MWFKKLKYSKLQNISQSIALRIFAEGSILQAKIILYVSCPAYLQRQYLMCVYEPKQHTQIVEPWPSASRKLLNFNQDHPSEKIVFSGQIPMEMMIW